MPNKLEIMPVIFRFIQLGQYLFLFFLKRISRCIFVSENVISRTKISDKIECNE